MTEPRFLVLEGCDGAGTTTQRERLASALRERGIPVHTTAEPSDGPIGRLLRAWLQAPGEGAHEREKLALAFAADRLDHVDTELRPRLDEGTWVVSDRYVLSSWVYQGLDGDLAWVRELNREAPMPDLTVLLDVSPATAAARRAARRGPVERYDDEALQAKLIERYRTLANEMGAAVIDGEAAAEDVTVALLDEIERRGWFL